MIRYQDFNFNTISIRNFENISTLKKMFIWKWSLSNAFWQFTVYVCINIISELFRKVEKIKQFNFKLYSSNDLSSFCIILTKQLTLSVTRPFDTSPAHYYKRSIVTMHLPWTITEIWCLEDNGVTSLTFWGHVKSSVTWPFDSRWSTSYGWSMVTMRPSGTVTEIWRHEHSTVKRTMSENNKCIDDSRQ